MSRTNSVCPFIYEDVLRPPVYTEPTESSANTYHMTTTKERSPVNTTKDLAIFRTKSTSRDSRSGVVVINSKQNVMNSNDDDIQLTFYEAMSPLFKFMQIMGLWHSDMIYPLKVKTKTRKVFNARNYSILVLFFLWLNFFRFVPSFFVGAELSSDRLYFKVIYMTVLLQSALNASMIFWATSSKTMLRDYFVHFERSIQMDKENKLDLVWLRKRSKIFTVIAITYVTFHFLNQTAGVFGPLESIRNSTNIFIAPFNPHPVLHVVCIFLNVYDFASWIFPLLYFLLTCMLMSKLFHSFDKRFGDEIEQAAANKVFPPNFEKLRHQHQELCMSVHLGNEGVFTYINLITYLTMGPLACFMLYQLLFASNIQGNLSAIFDVYNLVDVYFHKHLRGFMGCSCDECQGKICRSLL